MVFKGILSAACPECRVRKTKCDLSRPSCGQCIRTKRECSGPLDSTDRIFVHSRKAPRKTRPRNQSPMQSESAVSREAIFRQVNESPWPMGSNLLDQLTKRSLDNLGTSWFMHTRRKYCTQFAIQHTSFYSYHNRLNDTSIDQTIETLGLAGYAKETQQGRLMHIAETNYIKAIQSINYKLSTPETAMKDSVLFSIMMLVMYEGNTWQRESGMKNFTTHLDGLMSLASLSVKEGNLSILHRKAIAFVLRVFLFHYWYIHKPLPSAFFTVNEVAEYDLSRIQVDLQDLILAIVQFQTSARRETTAYMDIVQDGMQLHSAVQRFLDQIPPPRRWSECIIEGHSDLLYRGHIHFYPTTHPALHHNTLRISQIHCNLIIIDSCRYALETSSKKDEAITAQIAISQVAVKNIAKDVCASIPQLADYLDRLQLQDLVLEEQCQMDTPHQATTTLIELSPFLVYNSKSFRTRKINPVADGSRVPELDTFYHAFWVLKCLSEICFLDEDMRLWIEGRISWIETNAEQEDLEKLRAMRYELQKRVDLGLYKVSCRE